MLGRIPKVMRTQIPEQSFFRDALNHFVWNFGWTNGPIAAAEMPATFPKSRCDGRQLSAFWGRPR